MHDRTGAGGGGKILPPPSSPSPPSPSLGGLYFHNIQGHFFEKITAGPSILPHPDFFVF